MEPNEAPVGSVLKLASVYDDFIGTSDEISST
jgi:hypothetical protein